MTQAHAAAAAAGGGTGAKPGRIGLGGLSRYVLLAALAAMELGFAAIEPAVVSPRNLLNVVQQTSYLAVFAAAQMLVILTRGFDLSLGATVSAVSVASALAMSAAAGGGSGAPLVIAAGLGAGLALGAAVGLFNGACVALLRVNPFVTTLGSLSICFGIATIISDGRPVFDVPRPFTQLLYGGSLFGVPAPLLIALLTLALMHLMLERTVFGRALYLIGGNPRAAVLAGLPQKRYLALAYVLCSLLAATGALMLTARTGSGEPNLGGSLALQSIAAAVVGGVSLQGGLGGVGAVVLGALFVTALSNGMGVARVDGNVQQIVLGVVIIAAIFLDRLRVRGR